MAPPAHRRPGNSRKAQYSLFFGYIAGGIGAAIGLLVLVLTIHDPSFMAGPRAAGREAVAPASVAAAGGRQATTGLFESIAGYFNAGSKNAALSRELALARGKLIEAEATAEENRRLKALLALSTDDSPPVASAWLVGATASSTRRFATLAAGRSDGVATGMPVRSPLGLIGRVLEVGPSTARVLLITDSESVVPVRRAKDGVAAYAQGTGDGRLRLRLINLGINPIRKGDAFVTSGSGGLYPPGTPVAIVTRVTNDGGIALPASDPANSDLVLVEQAWSERVIAPAGSGPTP
jgi:rod shape-determining protein MreC